MVEVGLQVTILLFAALLGFVLARRFGQSAVIGEILVGIAIGPSLFGWVQYNDQIALLAELGAIFLLFTIGLECNYKHIYTVRNSVIAIVGIILPFAVGWWLAGLFGYTGIESMFIGVAMTATSIAITAHVLQEKGWLSEPVSKTILGAAVVDDILSLLALAIVNGMRGEFSWASFGWQTTIAVAFLIGALLLIKPLARLIKHIHKHAVARGEHQITIFAAMIIAFGYAGVAEVLGLSAIVGAFLAGVSMEPVDLPMLSEGATYFEMLFSAIFFVSLGVLMDLSQMEGAWMFAIILTVLAIITKWFGCWLPAMFTKHSMQESVAIGVGMIPRGEVAMIVGLLGLSTGVISQGVYGTIILMAFVTTIVTPPLLAMTMPKKA